MSLNILVEDESCPTTAMSTLLVCKLGTYTDMDGKRVLLYQICHLHTF